MAVRLSRAVSPVTTTETPEYKNAVRQLKRTLGTIEVGRETIAMTQRRIEAEQATVEKLMRDFKIDTFAEGKLVAEISEDMGNGKTTWDMAALQKKLGKNFIEAVEPVKKRIEAFLTAKEIAGVSTFEEGKSKGMSFKIKQPK